MSSTWAYLIVFGATLGTRKQVLDFLDEQDEVTYWYGCLPNCVFLTSTLTASALARRVRERFGDHRFLVAEVHEDRNGWLPKAAWHLFRSPEEPRLDEE